MRYTKALMSFRPWFLGIFAVAGCSALGSIASNGVDFAGGKADVHCDRRFVTDGGQAAAFCQEQAQTVAGAQFSDDCVANHKASAGPGLCPRESLIAGCLLDEHHDDDSTTTDWYYDVSGLLAEAGSHAGPDGGQTFDSVENSVAEVKATCADKTRYDPPAAPVTP